MNINRDKHIQILFSIKKRNMDGLNSSLMNIIRIGR